MRGRRSSDDPSFDTPNPAPDDSGGAPMPGRFDGIRRDYTPAGVARLAGSFRVQHTLADMGARRLWQPLKTGPFVNTLGALTGMQAVQQVKAGLKAMYLSGWQVAADANSGCQMYPDQSLYPVDSVPTVVRGINHGPRSRRRPGACASLGDRAAALRWRAAAAGTGRPRGATARPGSAGAAAQHPALTS
jgi:isocitrate lyase